MFSRLMIALLLLTISSYGFSTPAAFAQLGAEEEFAPLGAEEEFAPPPPDPLAPFNEAMFEFNLKLDEYALRPVATGYARVLPIGARRGVDRFFRNIGVIPRFANNLFQLRFTGAGQEIGRFVINTTLGGLGFFDVAEGWFGLEPSPADFGQTLWKYGVASGPYVMLPLFGPSTVRDAIGFAADNAMHPLNYLDVLSTLEWFAIRSGITVADAINFRSLNLELFEDADRYAVDLYGAVQDAYFQRREQELMVE